MTQKEIQEKVNAFLVDEYEKRPEQLIPEARIREDLEFNSLDYMDLMVTVKRTFGIMPVPAEMNLIITLGDFYDFIERKLQENEANG